ncbi:hypothetical protein QQF64_015816 [Cirrhinus molitorella]|uniref:Uncharacterized protein n=1 Tax=Cirrhinus molitorella TaxID=172907 RepID=A0ABR3LPP2_9TELE
MTQIDQCTSDPPASRTSDALPHVHDCSADELLIKRRSVMCDDALIKMSRSSVNKTADRSSSRDRLSALRLHAPKLPILVRRGLAS